MYDMKGEGERKLFDLWLIFKVNITARFQLNGQVYCQNKFSTRHVSNFTVVTKTLLHAKCLNACQ
jgi:hypothetical protein